MKKVYIYIFISINSFSQNFDVLPLYSENNSFNKELQIEFSEKNIDFRIDNPQLWFYQAKNYINKTPAVLIAPGGAYKNLAVNHEGIKVAEWFSENGISAFVLIYRTPFWEIDSMKNTTALNDSKIAIKKIRKIAELYNIDKSKIGAVGFSAGGHLISTLSNRFDYRLNNEDLKYNSQISRPDFSILFYPVISMKKDLTHSGTRSALIGKNPSLKEINFFSNELQIRENHPPTLIIHSVDDSVVNINSSELFYDSLVKNNIPTNFYKFPNGGHGFGFLENNQQSIKSKKIILEWLKNLEILTN